MIVPSAMTACLGTTTTPDVGGLPCDALGVTFGLPHVVGKSWGSVEWFTWTVAKPGRVPVRTFYRATIAEVQAHIELEGEVFALMAPPCPSPLPHLPSSPLQ